MLLRQLADKFHHPRAYVQGDYVAIVKRALLASPKRGSCCRFSTCVADARPLDVEVKTTHARGTDARRTVEEHCLRTRRSIESERGGAVDRDEARWCWFRHRRLLGRGCWSRRRR